jgi:hypothetical protein
LSILMPKPSRPHGRRGSCFPDHQLGGLREVPRAFSGWNHSASDTIAGGREYLPSERHTAPPNRGLYPLVPQNPAIIVALCHRMDGSLAPHSNLPTTRAARLAHLMVNEWGAAHCSEYREGCRICCEGSRGERWPIAHLHCTPVRWRYNLAAFQINQVIALARRAFHGLIHFWLIVGILRKALHDITSIRAAEREWPRHGRSSSASDC